MTKNKENYYQDVDRSVLIELKNVLKALEYKKVRGELLPAEAKAYVDLQELFTDTLTRPFLQGDNEFSFVNDMDRNTFMKAISSTLTYLIAVTGIPDSYIVNRLGLIVDMNRQVEHEIEATEFADGHVVEISNMPEEEYMRAAREFSEGSEALNSFLMYTYGKGLYTMACCKGHACKNGTKTPAYIAFSLKDNYEQKLYLMSRAFEAGMEVAIIDFDDGLGFDILLNPYDRERQIDLLTKALIEYKKDEKINPVVSEVMGYMEHIGHGEEYSSIEIFKDGEYVGIEEHTPLNNSMRGVFREEDVIKAYSEKDSTNLKQGQVLPKAPVYASSRDAAKTALTMTTKTPGRFSQAMKNGLQVFKKMLHRNKEESTIEL